MYKRIEQAFGVNREGQDFDELLDIDIGIQKKRLEKQQKKMKKIRISEKIKKK